MNFKHILHDIWSNGPGRIGLILLTFLLVLSIYAIFRFPPGFGTEQWSNPTVWSDNPKNVPPVWLNYISTRQAMPHTELISMQPSNFTRAGTNKVDIYRLSMGFSADEAPSFIVLSIRDIRFHSKPPIFTVRITRPDGSVITLDRFTVSGPRDKESPPFQRNQEEPLRKTLTGNSQIAEDLRQFFLNTYGVKPSLEFVQNNAALAIMGTPVIGESDAFELLEGQYEFVVTVTKNDERDHVDVIKFTLGGTLFGLMGTDAQGRDLASGLLAGLPIALFIGIMASLLTTAIGTTLGIASGFAGGKTDLLIQRMTDVVGNAPVLPLLIFLVFIFQPNLFLIILLLVAFSWPGLTILVRSMILQIRSGQLVDSAKVIGASPWRIMFRYLFPQTAPFVLAQMIFFTPAAILAEAGLSFLGLGDPSIPTWGQILAEGFRTGAVFLGWWWWIVPPGLLIVITAVTFMLLALGLEPVINPKLHNVVTKRQVSKENPQVEGMA